MNIVVSLFIFLLLSIASPSYGRASQTGQPSDLYKRWEHISTDELLKKAVAYMDDTLKRDSALVWFGVVANRYYDRGLTDEERSKAIKAMNNLGYMYFYYYQDYVKSYSYLTKGLKCATENKFNTHFPYLYLNMGNLYAVNQDLSNNELIQDMTLEYYKKAFHASVSMHNYPMLCITVNNMLLQAYNDNLIDEVKAELDSFATMKIPRETDLLEYDRCLLRAIMSLRSQDYETALSECDKAAKEVSTANTPERYLGDALGLKAHALSLMGFHEEAKALFHKVEALAMKSDGKDFLLDVYRELGQFYRDAGEEQLSHQYRVKYLELKDSLLTDGRMKTVGEMRFLNKVNTANERAAEEQKLRMVQTAALRVAVGVIVVIAIMLLLLGLAYRRQRATNRCLYEKSLDALRREDTERSLRRQLQEQASQTESNEEGSPKPAQPHTMEEEESNQLMLRIEQVMENTDTICATDFSQKRLAELVECKYWIVSQVIKDKRGKNFNTLLNDYRISEACRRLNDIENNGKFTIEAIASSLGFKSRSNFTTVFKRITGIAPSEYLRIARESNK